MSEDRHIRDLENAHLKEIITEIEKQRLTAGEGAENSAKAALSLQKEMAGEVRCAPADLFDLEDAIEAMQYQTAITQQAMTYQFRRDRAEILTRMAQSPYFARIDFREENQEAPEAIYIGGAGLTDSVSFDILIYDWRAPVATLFYDFETGPCGYLGPAVEIRGEMSLKRQFQIEAGKIVYMFDSSLSIQDEILRELLGKSTNHQMKAIVSSIQREQNQVIRNDQDRVLLVEGPAGSGKTSIALHRAAYLLYAHRESLRAEHILIFSPNHVFAAYIAAVLPELGEDNVVAGTFLDYFGGKLQGRYHLETMTQQLEAVSSGFSDAGRHEAMSFKASSHFLELLEAYAVSLEDGKGLGFKDILYDGEVVISAKECRRLFGEDYCFLPYGKRLAKLGNRIRYLLEQCYQSRLALLKADEKLTDAVKRAALKEAKAERQHLETEIDDITHSDAVSLYAGLFREPGSIPAEVAGVTLTELDGGLILYEDCGPIAYLSAVLGLIAPDNEIKHVIVDEAQDFTVTQFAVLRKIFPEASLTILGDTQQVLHPYGNRAGFGGIAAVFGEEQVHRLTLTKSYRSSQEIALFCAALLTAAVPGETLCRPGNKPKLIEVAAGRLWDRIAADIQTLQGRGQRLIAVICKTGARCKAAKQGLDPFLEADLISNQHEVYRGGVVVIPAYLAKGLEFDAVLVPFAGAADYGEEERGLLYTICTRALHELYLYPGEPISPLLEPIDTDLYERES